MWFWLHFLHWVFQTICLLLSSLPHPYSKHMASTPIFPKAKPTYISCFNLSASLRNFSVPSYLPQRRKCSCSCQDNASSCALHLKLFHLFRASLQSFLLHFQSLSPSWTFLPSKKYIQVSSRPKALPLFCYTYVICSGKQRRFTANPFERIAYTHCFIFPTMHSCEPLQSGLCHRHPEKLHAPRS